MARWSVSQPRGIGARGHCAERCITTAVRSRVETPALAELRFSAATDHRYLTTGS
jgi:hypothetical protein